MKICIRCNKKKNNDNFQKDGRRGTLYNACKDCSLKQARETRVGKKVGMDYKDYLIQQNQMGAYQRAIKTTA